MIHETDVLQATGYAIIFRGKYHGGLVWRDSGWYAYMGTSNYIAESPLEALRLAFDDYRDWVLGMNRMSAEDINTFERELFAAFESEDILAAV